MQSLQDSDTKAQDVEISDLATLSLASPDSLTREYPREMSKHASVPWYEDPNASHPFSLSAKTRATRASASSFTGVEYFPWRETPLAQLWNANVYMTEDDPQSVWLYLIQKWRNVVAICGGRFVRLVHTSLGRLGSPLFQVALPEECRFPVSHLKWALNPSNLHPLLIYIHSNVLHIFDVENRAFLGCTSGHGGDITSLGVHPLHPHLVYTTSRDCTTRIYDLRHTSHVEGQPRPSQISQTSAFAMRIDHHEGNCTIGKCAVVLTGGRSGGHEAAVLDASFQDFHPSLPLIVTCGLDHAVRIWHLKPQLFLKDGYLPLGTHTIDWEDKPLFSSTMIHDARVLSVHWEDGLTPRAQHFNQPYSEGYHMTFCCLTTPHPSHKETDKILSAGSSDLQGTSIARLHFASFKIISVSRLPVDTSWLSVHRHPYRPPLILLPVGGTIVLLNSSHLPPRKRPILRDELVREVEGYRPVKRVRLVSDTIENMHTDVEGWTLSVALGEDLEDEDLEACAMSPDGQQVAAVGAREGLWIWKQSRRLSTAT